MSHNKNVIIPLTEAMLPRAPELKYAYHHFDEMPSVFFHILVHTLTPPAETKDTSKYGTKFLL